MSVVEKANQTGYKTCSRCGKEKPLDIMHWTRTKSTKDGFHTICKSCRNKTNKVIIPVDESDGFRICSKCKMRKPLNIDYFKKNKQNYKGYNTICRECTSKRDKIKRGTYKEGHYTCRQCLREYKQSEENFPKDNFFKSGLSDICHNCNIVNEKIGSQTLKEGNKFCTNCGEQYPETKDYFFKRGKGFDCHCKECRGYEFGIKQNVMNRKTIEGHKYCTECKQLLPLSSKYFYKNNSIEDGFTTQCKKCIRKWQINNIDSIRKNKKIYQQIRRSRKKQLTNDFTIDDWVDCKEYFNNSCCYCGKKTKELQQDHLVPLSKDGPYTKDNIVPACKRCNVSKKDDDFDEWYPQQEFYSKERENKILRYLKSGS